ncbi:DUF3265 domain-containing protein [Vibrio sp. D420a]|nr:DUF3265 domain-containing protein [Vibrio sp. D420a]
MLNSNKQSKQTVNAWHFYYAAVLVVKMVCGGIGIACLTPKQGLMF